MTIYTRKEGNPGGGGFNGILNGRPPHWCKHNSNIGGNTSEEASMEGETICVRKLSFIFELCLGISKGM